MASWGEVVDGVAGWVVPSGVLATVEVASVVSDLVVRLRLAGRPWGEARVVFDRPATAGWVTERLDQAVDDLRVGSAVVAVAYRSATHRGGRPDSLCDPK